MNAAVVSRMIVLFAIMAIGYIAGKARVMSLEGNKPLSKLVNYVTNPCNLLYSALCGQRSLTNTQIFQLLAIAVAMFLFLMLVCQPLPRLLKVPKEQQGQYKFMIMFSNIGYMGIPVISAIFGASASVSAAIFIMVFYVFIYSYGVFLLQGGKGAFRFRALLTPMMFASILSITGYLLNIQIGGAGAELLKMLGGVTTPCAMLIIGCALSTLPVKALFSNWRLYVVSLVKLLVIPGVVFLCLNPIFGEHIVFRILIVMLAMPIASNFTMLSAIYNRDQQLPATAVFITTAMSVVTIPLLSILLSP